MEATQKGELDQERSAIPCGRGQDGKKKKKPLDVAMATPGWPTPYDVWLSGQMRTKGGIKTGVDLGANGAEDSGEERDGGEGQDGEVPAVTKGVSL